MIIKPLEEWTLGNRIALTFIVVLAVLLALAVIGFLSGGWDAEAQQAKSPPVSQAIQNAGSPWDADILTLDRLAVDEAYRTQIEHLFAVWMKDDTSQPTRAIKGANQARAAYIAIRDEIARRERELPKP